MHKSRSWRRSQVRTPGNRLVTRYTKKKQGKAICANCKKPLHGVPSKRAKEMRKLAKSKKSVERPYGGNLCSECMREVFREKVRE